MVTPAESTRPSCRPRYRGSCARLPLLPGNADRFGEMPDWLEQCRTVPLKAVAPVQIRSGLRMKYQVRDLTVDAGGQVLDRCRAECGQEQPPVGGMCPDGSTQCGRHWQPRCEPV